MGRQLILALGLFVLAVLGAAMLRPGPAIRFEADLAALEPEEALALLSEADPAIAGQANIRLIQARLSLAAGDTEGVRDALSGLAGDPKLNDIAAELQADALTLDGDLAGAAARLQEAHLARPTTERRLRLGALLRLQRRVDDELALLESAPISGLTTGEAKRLAQLLLLTGRQDELTRVYRLLADNPRREDDTFRRRLIDHLTESGDIREAVVTTLRWFDEGDRKAGPIEIAIASLISRGALDEAYYLATVYMDAAHDLGHIAIPAFARSGDIPIALALQDRWLATAGEISPEAWETLISVTNMTGDDRGLRAALMATRLDAMAPAALDGALTQILRYRGVAALAPYRAALSPELLRRTPLTGAALMQSQGRQDAMVDYLLLAAAGDLSDWQVRIWLSLATQAQRGPAYRLLLLRGTGDPRIDRALGVGIISEATPVTGR
ncbi:MAG: hypothetical protein ACK5MQ_13535 [Pikeienuella sp.]